MQTKLMKHNIYNNKIQLNKKYWQELGFKENDKISISKLEEGKIVVERIGDDEWDSKNKLMLSPDEKKSIQFIKE